MMMYTRETQQKPWYQQTRTYVLALVALLLFVLLYNVVDYFRIVQMGNKWDSDLSTAYYDGQQDQSKYFTDSENQLHIAQANAKDLQAILVGMAQHTLSTSKDFDSPTNAFAMIATNYPNVGNASEAYNDLSVIMIGTYNNYAEDQKAMRAMLASYDQWRLDPFDGWLIKMAGYPSDLLTIDDGTNNPPTGAAAERVMKEFIGAPEVLDSLKKHQLDPITFPTPGN